jgi:FKBP-type peptidyl-prolyl cis-trans isomerase
MRTSIRPVVAIAFVVAALWTPRAAFAQASALLPPPDLASPPPDATKSTSGLISKAMRAGTGTDKPAATDVVTVNYTGWASDGRMFDSSVSRGNPSTFTLNRVMAGWRECVQLMVVGETRRCWVPQDLAYKGQAGRPTGTVVFDIELVDTRPSPTIPPPDVAGPPEDAKRTASGLAYKVLRPGTGVRHPDGLREVTVHYTGWTTDGKMFDSSVPRGAPTTMRLDEVIRGWTEGVPLMVEGERTRFWIPQDLAYRGQAGSPRGMLVFDIELVRIN